MATDFQILGIIGAPPAAALASAGDWTDLVNRVDALEAYDHLARVSAQDDPDNSTNASTSVYAIAMDYSFTLPDGTWTVQVIGGVACKHSAAGGVNLRIQIAGDPGANTSRNVPSASFEVLVALHALTITDNPGLKVVQIEFKSGVAGTTTADNPWLVILALRDDTP